MKIVLPSAVEVADVSSVASVEAMSDDLVTVEAKHVALAAGARSGGTPAVYEIGKDDVVELSFEDGSRWFLGEAELAEIHSRQPNASRGGAADDAIVIDGTLFQDSLSRGVFTDAIRTVRVLVVKLRDGLTSEAEDLPTDAIVSGAEDQIKALVVDPLAYGIARKIEKSLIDEGVSRLCRVHVGEGDDTLTRTLSLETLESLDFLDPKKPVLLLLHGTLSSTAGSFSDLWRTQPETWRRLGEHFDDQILALEHCTLTESPVENALQIARLLPDKIRLHLLSHSRGGLIGELLCRGTRDGMDAFSSDEIEMFEVQRDASQERFDLSARLFDALKRQFAGELERLNELNGLLSKKNIAVERFVRVGCPARGTTLASGRLHRWSNRALNALGLISGQTLNPLYRAFESFTLGILKANAKPEVLPGLQAQMPSSALIHLLNHDLVPVPADLAIVAGDIEAKGGLNWKRIPIWFTDRFYGGENDLVVNTASMDGGSDRENGIRALSVRGEHVNHFSYFANADSSKQLVGYLVGDRAPRFERIERVDEVHIARGKSREHKGGRPVLVLVPGILGSELKQDGKRIWAHPNRLLRGGISKLHIKAADVSATGVMERAYGAFLDEFSATHDVHPCPYDWRYSLSASADTLANQIENILDAQVIANDIQPIRIVAHSMGGLVCRMMIAQHPKTWKRVAALPGSRLLMAGTPTNGSYAINRIVSGELKLIRLLALADLKNSRRDITELAAQFPGLAAMLPGFGELEWLHEGTWDDVEASASGGHWSRIPKALLSAARLERQALLNAPLDSTLVSYVAGWSERTPADAFFDSTRNGRVCFRYTREGDGQVTWKDGVPSGLRNVFYQPTVHGSLLDASDHFNAWKELLESGHTERLSREALSISTSRGVAPTTWTESEPDDIDYLPDETSLLELALGMEPSAKKPAAPPGSIAVSVVHGDLAFAEHPVAVGHYDGDSIARAEAALDRTLEGRLSERHLIGQYPGPIGTSAVVFSRSNPAFPEGGLVVGLGEFGELSAAMLERAMTAGFVNYILEVNDWWASPGRDEPAPGGIGVATLLIGSGLGLMSVHDSVGVLLRSVRSANEAVRLSKLSDTRLIDKLVLVELWQDLALQATDSATRWCETLDGVEADGELQEGQGGRRRSHYGVSRDWWHSISIRQGESENEVIFDDYTRQARNELTREPIDRRFVDRFIEQAIGTTTFDRRAKVSPQRALFELLLPRSIKERSPDSDRLRLILDEHTAHVPWEMLVDGWGPNNEPLVISKMVIRRLSLENFRSRPEPARGFGVLIVGDPPSGKDPYPELPGARIEASQVDEAFARHVKYDVQSFIANQNTAKDGESMALGIVEALYSGEFRILHFAGHGSYYRAGTGQGGDPEDEGMIIGEGLRLTPTLVRKMRKTPALVFLNCCHLGLVENRTNDGVVRFNKIAANLATQFIRMGAQAVVAAGWEIEDKPAAHFAAVFYDYMLRNETFSSAVDAARKSTYDAYKNCNTFGAYQCWGDPDFLLDPTSRAAGARGVSHRYASPQEYEIAASNIRNEALSAAESRRIELKRDTDRLLDSIKHQYGDPWRSPETRGSSWQGTRVSALASLGRAYGELGVLPFAIRLLRIAYRLDASRLSVEDLEQLANFECRYAVELSRIKDAERDELVREFEAPGRLLRAGRDRLDSLLKQHAASGRLYAQREILCLVGSGAKRDAMLRRKTATRRLKRALAEMRLYYGLGWTGGHLELDEDSGVETFIDQAALNQEPPDDYAFINFALASIMLRWYQDDVQPWPEAFVELVRRYAVDAASARKRSTDFWGATGEVGAMLLPYLDEELDDRVGLGGTVDTFVPYAQATFTRVGRRFGSVRQWDSVAGHMDFAADMLAKKPDSERSENDAACLTGIQDVQRTAEELMRR